MAIARYYWDWTSTFRWIRRRWSEFGGHCVTGFVPSFGLTVSEPTTAKPTKSSDYDGQISPDTCFRARRPPGPSRFAISRQ